MVNLLGFLNRGSKTEKLELPTATYDTTSSSPNQDKQGNISDKPTPKDYRRLDRLVKGDEITIKGKKQIIDRFFDEGVANEVSKELTALSKSIASKDITPDNAARALRRITTQVQYNDLDYKPPQNIKNVGQNSRNKSKTGNHAGHLPPLQGKNSASSLLEGRSAGSLLHTRSGSTPKLMGGNRSRGRIK